MLNLSRRSLWASCSLAFCVAQASMAVHASEQTKDCREDGESPPFEYDIPLVKGPFDASAESLKTYQTPEWFRDAKFGIWAHWGPQAVPRAGDWYARNMYLQGSRQYKHHLEHYGHPTEFGYKDIIPLWKAEKFDPEALMGLYAKAGAKYFVSMGVHHDNFDLWDSKYHRWNAVDMGPHRDIVGEFKKAAEKRGLRFGVSEHLAASYTWFSASHGFDRDWTPHSNHLYDGADPAYKDLYHEGDEQFQWRGDTWYAKNPQWHQEWFNRITDLVENYQPDLVYTDGGIPFGKVGRTMVANFYNQSVAAHNGKLEAVYNLKDLGRGEFYREAGVQTVERGVMSGINPLPWQTDTSMGDWFYSDGFEYKTTPQIIHMLADIVSKNGNLLLNVVQYPDGSLPPEPLKFLKEMAVWMDVNGEAIHGTRPWVIYGEGPTETAGGSFNEGASYTAEDVRFTTKNASLYAIVLGIPKKQVRIRALGLDGQAAGKTIKSVELLGYSKTLKWKQDNGALTIKVPGKMPTKYAASFKIEFF